MATHMFIKFETPDIDGGSAMKGHEKEIEVISWSHGFSQPASSVRSAAGGGTIEKADHGDFNFTKYMDSATDDLLKYCWNGKHIGKAIFKAYRADGEKTPGALYLQIEMESVVVSSYSTGGGGGDIPSESISLGYNKVTYTYKGQDKDKGAEGKQQVTYADLKAGEVA